MNDIDQKLTEVLEWAQGKLDSNQEPPWAVDGYQNLVDSLSAVITGRESTMPAEDLQRLAKQLETGPQQGGSVIPLGNALLRQGKAKVQLPM
ncbi:MAG: hypothetical protein PsegKO_33870 [Pseudohongiellaceae bacterium]